MMSTGLYQRRSATATPGRTDLVIAGAGVVGLTLAIALARTGYAVTVLGPLSEGGNGRTVALLDGSVRLLTALGVWPRLAARAAPLKVMRIVDDTGSLFRIPPVEFKAAEIGLSAFGYNIGNDDLEAALGDVALETRGFTRMEARLAGHTADETCLRATVDNGVHVTADLLIAADGAGSPARTRGGITVRERRYPQVALTMVLTHEAPHDDVSTEFHTREGPFTLVPMTPTERAAHRSSLVWVMPPHEAERRLALGPEDFGREVERQSRFLLGGVSIEGGIGRFPLRRLLAQRLVGPRLALAGEAAHALPPIGAQGLNLSLRDAAVLVDLLARARAEERDPGSSRVLDGYERQRSGDIALRAAGVDAMNRSLLSSWLPVDLVRGAGLLTLATLPFARRAVMRQGLMPRHAIPSLMR